MSHPQILSQSYEAKYTRIVGLAISSGYISGWQMQCGTQIQLAS